MAVKIKKALTKDDIFRIILLCLCLLFSLVSTIYFSAIRQSGKAMMCLLSIVYVLIPDIIQRIFKFRIQTVLYTFIVLYTICPMLGYSYKLYYILPWWDDLLHAFAGLIFAMFGAYLPRVLNKKAPCSIALGALFALTFSIAVSAVWEFIEFSMDSNFGTDMQKDTFLTSVRPSYLLGELLGLPIGELGYFHDIEEIILKNPEGTISIKGYIDVGLLDTMHDMLVNIAGALLYMAIYIIGKGKVFVFQSTENENFDICVDSDIKNVEGIVATENAKLPVQEEIALTQIPEEPESKTE